MASGVTSTRPSGDDDLFTTVVPDDCSNGLVNNY
jgi:hypothetical protein